VSVEIEYDSLASIGARYLSSIDDYVRNQADSYPRTHNYTANVRALLTLEFEDRLASQVRAVAQKKAVGRAEGYAPRDGGGG
jgi:hypothetical protein